MSAQYLPIGCYGKVPCYGDYVARNASHPSSHALTEWMHEAVEEAALEAKEAGTAVIAAKTARRFLFGAEGSAELVAGVIRPSTDQGALREFPFAVFTHVSRRHCGKRYHLFPMALSPVWDALDDAWESLANVASKPVFDEVLEGLQVPAPVSAKEVGLEYEAAREQEMTPLFQREDGASQALLVAQLPSVLDRLRKEGAGRLELPVSQEPSAAAFDTAFWMDFLNRQLPWRRFEPVVFLGKPPETKDCSVLLVFGMIRPSDYGVIMGAGSGQGAGEVLRPAHPAEPGESPDDREAVSETYEEFAARRVGA